MNELVFINKDGKEVTDSLIVANEFGKNHKDVLRDIKRLDCSPKFNERNFAPIEYIDSRGRTQRAYELTWQGLVFLVMGYRGEKAAEIKENFINEFERMRNYIFNQQKEELESEFRLDSFIFTSQQAQLDRFWDKQDREDLIPPWNKKW